MPGFEYKGKPVVINGPATDHICKIIAKKSTFYEVEMLEYLGDLNANGVYIDVGANLGNHTIFMAKLPQCEEVYAFEPFQSVYRFLEQNIADNNLAGQVKLMPMALGKEAGRAGLKPGPDGNLGMTSLESGDDVEVARLDDVVPPDGVAVIKIDVEGHELPVLEGATQVLARSRPHLFIEAATDEHKQKIDAFLSPLGYVAVNRFNATPTYHYRQRTLVEKLFKRG